MVRTLQAAARQVTNLPPHRARSSLDMLARLAPPTVGVRRQATTIGGVRAEWLIPWGWRDGVTLMHIHGGGYALCSPITHRMMVSDIARSSGARGLAIAYRLAPEHPFPAALDDCESAYHGLLQRGVAPERLVLSGDSAGGALALATLFRIRDQGVPMPRAVVLLSPWADLKCEGSSITKNVGLDYLNGTFMRFFARLYLDGADPQNRLASPIHGTFDGFPPMLVQAGGAELLMSDIERLVEQAEADGVEVTYQIWEGMVHAFQGFTLFMPEARQAMVVVGQYIRDITSSQPERRQFSAAPAEPPRG